MFRSLSRSTVAAGVLLLSSVPAAAQVTFGTPETVFDGAAHDAQVLETDVAVGKNNVMSVWINHVPGSPTRIGWSMRSNVSGAGTWTDGVIPRFAMPDPLFTTVQGVPIDRFSSFTDPSVAYSPAWDDKPEAFMACALASKGAGPGLVGFYSCVVVSFFEPSAPAAGWSDWIILDCVAAVAKDGIPPFITLDKPFIVAGSPNEFYVTHMSSEGGIHYHYSRTDNGGRTTVSNGGWLMGTDVLVGGSPVSGFFAMQPTAYASSDLYCAYNSGGGLFNTRFRFLRGVDGPAMTVDFSRLLETGGSPVEITWSSKVDSSLPGTFDSGTVAQPAVDPTDPDHLYVVGTRRENGNDIDVMFNELVRTGLDWSVTHPGDGLVIHNDPAPPSTNCETSQLTSTDQFCPAITVDNQGRIHVVYYSDREFDQKDGVTGAGECLEPRYDLAYAISVDGGATFRDFPRPAPSGQAAWMDFNPDLTGFPYPGPREYIGVEFVRGFDRSYVWASLSGHDATSGISPFSVIWAQLFEVQ